MDRYASDYLGALWDVHNVYRVGGESPATTIKNLGAYVKHVHMRDSDDDGSFNLVGEGTLPIDEVVRALSSIDYDGFVSLEWDPAWMADLTDMEVIFPHYVNYMEQLRGHPRQAPHALPQPRRHRRVRVEEGRAHRSDLPAGARQDGRMLPRPVLLQVHHAGLHAHLRGVPRRRGHVRPRARVDGRQARQQGGHLGHQRARLVHHLLGRHEDRRRVGHGEYRLQDPRGRVPAAPVRHAHAGHDRQRA